MVVLISGQAPNRLRQVNPLCDSHGELVSLEIASATWVDFVNAAPGATVFHHPAWAGLLAECYGYRPFVLALMDRAGRIAAGLPILEADAPLLARRWISLPFTDHCELLVRDELAATAFTSALVEYSLRNHTPPLEVRATLAPNAAVHQGSRHVLHSLAIQSDSERTFSRLGKKFRQYTRKAERSGLYASVATSRRDIDIFYTLHTKTRQKLGIPVQPKRFFYLLWDRLIANGLGEMIIVRNQDGEPVSGAVMLSRNMSAMIKFSASDPAYLNTRCHYFTFWKCIEWACDAGMAVIDFGRTDISDRGLRTFKAGWGAQEETLVYSRISQAPPKPVMAGLRSPVRALIRRSPSWFCRAIGELLYKFAA